MKNTVLFSAAILAGTAFLSCSRQDNGDDKSMNTVRQTESLRFGAIRFQKSNELKGSAGDYFRDTDITYTDSISLIMPEDLPGQNLSALRDSIIRMAFDTTGTDIDKIISGFISKDAGQFSYPIHEVAPVDISQADGFAYVSGSVVNYNPALLVYEVAISSYNPGAAHGITTRNYLNYDLDSGRILDGKFMFDPAKRSDLIAIIARRAEEMTDVLGPTQIDDLPENNNFYINPEGEIVFVYQPYEVASYAQGLISISFYPAELSECLTAAAMKYFSLDDLN